MRPTTEVMLMMRPLRAFIMPRKHRLGEPEDGRQIGVEHGVPILLLHAQQQGVAGDPGIVAENADGPLLGFDVLDQRFDRLGLSPRRAPRRVRRAPPDSR